MKIREISYEKSVLTPTGQYGNIRLGAVITYSLEEGEEPNHQQARTDLNTAIEYQKNGSALDTEFPDKGQNGDMPFDNPPTPTTPRLVEQVKRVAEMAHQQSETQSANVAACPKCEAPLKEARKKDGSIYYKCSTNKWDRVTGTATGCDYVNWGDSVRPAQATGKLASPAQERIIKQKWPQEWVEGMTMGEAFKVIASHPR